MIGTALYICRSIVLHPACLFQIEFPLPPQESNEIRLIIIPIHKWANLEILNNFPKNTQIVSKVKIQAWAARC